MERLGWVGGRSFPIPKRVVGRIGMDLDGTLAEQVWPSSGIGNPIPLGIEALEFYYDQGYEVWIFTSRPASHAPRIWTWLDGLGLREKVYEVRCDKPLMDMLIDDRVLKFPEGLQ